MPESENVEFAHKLSEREGRDKARKEHAAWEEFVEIVEVLVLAIIAIATAWSGYQAARWDGREALLYGTAARYRFAANAASTTGGQVLSADAAIFTAWLQAESAHNGKLAAVYVRRFTPDYRSAFLAWLKTDPLRNPAAPPGPAYMRQYRNPYLVSGARLNRRASAAFDQGTDAGDTGERYVRDTVLFAAVLFLVAIAQRFKLRNIRYATTALALALLVYTAVSVVELPRL
jgi:hypothetical protein